MRRKLIKTTIILSFAICIAAIPKVQASAAWQKDSKGWWYSEGKSYLKDCSKYIDGTWYYFDSNGYLKTGWVKDSESAIWYYFDNNGVKARNTEINGYLLAQDGNLLEGVTKDDVNKFRQIMKANIDPSILDSNYREVGIYTENNFAPKGYDINLKRVICFAMKDTSNYLDPQNCIVDMDTNKVYLFDTGYSLYECKNHNKTAFEMNDDF